MVQFTPELNAALTQLLTDFPDLPLANLTEFQVLLTQGDDLVDSFTNFPFTLEELQSIILSFSGFPSFLQAPFDDLIARYIVDFPSNAELIWESIKESNSSGTSLDLFDNILAAIINTPTVNASTKQEIFALLESSGADATTIAAVDSAYNESNLTGLSQASADLQQSILLYKVYEPYFAQVISRFNTNRILTGMENAKSIVDNTITQLSA
jgi:hypothetical protein